MTSDLLKLSFLLDATKHDQTSIDEHVKSLAQHSEEASTKKYRSVYLFIDKYI